MPSRWQADDNFICRLRRLVRGRSKERVRLISLRARAPHVRLALGVMSREGGEDPWWSPSSGDVHKATRPLRVALVTRPAGHSAAPQVSEGVYRAGDILEKAGYDVEEVDPLPANADQIS